MALREMRAAVRSFTASFDAAVIAPHDAERVVRDVTVMVNMLETVRALAAGRASQGGQWRRDGAPSPAHDLARKTGSSVSKAREALDTAEKLGSLPSVDEAARAGRLSPAQVAPIADAAAADPGAAARLVEKARRAPLHELRDECARTKAAAEPDDGARHAAIHRSRHLRKRRCPDGAAELAYRSTVDEVAEVFSVVQGFANREFDLARSGGRREPEEAYLADGLLAACRAAAGAGGDAGAGARAGAPAGTRLRKPTPTKIVVRIDWDALLRGWPIDAEVSEIAGLGPVPVSVVRAMMASGDAFLAGVVTKGVDVANVFHLGRKPTAYQGSALDWTSPTCTTLGCGNTHRLETDHRIEWSTSKVTLLRWLERHCEPCHHKRSRLGWALVEGRGKRPLVPPEDPRHPRHAPPFADTG